MTNAVETLLRAQPFYCGNITHVHRETPVPPRYRAPKDPLPPALARYVEGRRLELFESQAETIDAFRGGNDVVIATRTDSGKTEAFNLCVGELLLADKTATALYVYPTKALAHDQVERLIEFDQGAGLNAHPAAYDGDTPTSRRAQVRRDSRIIASNWYGIHEYLPQVASMQAFLSRLAVVVIDESHSYRGIYGTNVGFVIRRLQRICDRLGANPRYLLASGTIANPGEHAAELTGREVAVVDSEGSGHGERTVLIWDSMNDPDRSLSTQAAMLTAAVASDGYGTICFCGSRVGTEWVAQRAGELSKRKIGVYRAGLLPTERRTVEENLRSGQLTAVVSTNALEVGIDIGGLDIAIVAGYPGTISAWRQEWGRAGRGGRASTAIFMAGSDPLDQFWIRRPELLFSAPVERAVVSLSNPEVLAGQVLCAAAEFPVRDEETCRFGEGLSSSVAALTKEGLLSAGRVGYTFSGTGRPASLVHLDGRSDDSVEVRTDDGLVEIMEHHRALQEAHKGAILLHAGRRLRVIDLDLSRGVALAEPVEAREYTRAICTRDFALGEIEKLRTIGDWDLSWGPAQVWTYVTGYKIYRGDELLGIHELELPPSELNTQGAWLSPRDARAPEDALSERLLGSLHAAEHGLVHALGLLAMCDRGDAGGLSTLMHRFGTGCLLMIYDGHEGGVGIAEMAYERFEQLASLTFEMIDSCDCDLGCPRCVFDRFCGNDNEPMDRLGAVEILANMLHGGRADRIVKCP